ncbi:molybdopterin-dependent oxidoreductase [Adlercreutzia aquisgranensis]|nr:molybdopterin-dependent oxidoreductase [Adlercreutzia aquisgranensis]
MGEKNVSQGTLSRRGFLKATGAAAGALGLAGAAGMTTAQDWLAPAQAHAEGEEKVAYLCHQFHCLGNCCLKCTVRDGRLALIEPNDAVRKEDQRICLRGINEIQHVYAADRIQTPLKRVGERGEGKFEAISWDEAIETIANAIKESQEKYGDNSFFFRKSTEASSAHGFDFLSKLLHAETGGNWGLDRGQANGWNPGAGVGSWSPGNNSLAEWPLASTVIFLGDNILESGIVWSRGLFDAKEAGAKIITVDTRFSPTASKSDQWISVKPGTDAALIIGMIRAIMDEGWCDEEFIKAHTGYPYLIDEATGEIYGEMRDVTNEKTGEVTQKKAPYVWDAVSSSARLYDEEGIDPAIEGSWKLDGRTLTTEFSVLKKAYEPYTLDWASQITSVPSETIKGLADDYANRGPAFICFGLGGPDKYANADVLGHALVLVTALTGNIGKKGCGTGWYGAGGAFHSTTALRAWELPDEFKAAKSECEMYNMPYKDNNIHVALTFGDAFTLEAADANSMLDWVKSLDFYAICDIYHSSAVDYADIVLPACTKFECDEEITDLRNCKGYLALGQKCIDPLFESKTDLEVERLIAAQWGYDQYLPKSHEEYARHRLSEAKGNIEGFTIEAFKANQGVLRFLDSDEPMRSSCQFTTETGRLEPYYEKQIKFGQAFPVYETPNEAFEENPLHEQYPLVFVQGKSRFRIHAYYSASSWFQEYFGPVVNISPGDAQTRGIETGDEVRISNDRGTFVCTALVNNAIQPGTLFMAETTYNHYYPEGFLQNVTNSYRQERCYEMTHGPQIPYNDTLVEIEKA